MNNPTTPDHDHVHHAPDAPAITPSDPRTDSPAHTGGAGAGLARAGEPASESIADPHGRPPMTPEMKKAAGEIFDPSASFESLGLRSSVLKGVEAAGFSKPTSIQAKLIPAMINGHDVLGQAKTGTGKTAAFGLPLIHLCNKDEPFQGLVLAPTRELAIQISQEINELARFTPIRATTIYGGQAIRQQAKNLSQASQIIVGTPG
ncbi:MAG: DEAD/DEAH box helicase, partial [Phycisphaerae bacterium]|nr:DEAD/DEAH box helicase [Phycisphaerae bacterium]